MDSLKPIPKLLYYIFYDFLGYRVLLLSYVELLVLTTKKAPLLKLFHTVEVLAVSSLKTTTPTTSTNKQNNTKQKLQTL